MIFRVPLPPRFDISDVLMHREVSPHEYSELQYAIFPNEAAFRHFVNEISKKAVERVYQNICDDLVKAFDYSKERTKKQQTNYTADGRLVGAVVAVENAFENAYKDACDALRYSKERTKSQYGGY